MRNIQQYWVYIMANHHRNVIYIGVTNNLHRRYFEHKNEINPGFTQKYKCHDLIYFEEHALVEEAIAREKQLKGWRREKKIELIRSVNPWLKDLAEDLGWTEIPHFVRDDKGVSKDEFTLKRGTQL